MKSCRACRTLYPEIVPEADDVCQECLADWETADLDSVATAMLLELESRRPVPIAVVR